jgi:hypothetical protein
VITTGAQTYNDPVVATVPVSFTGGAIAATQTANSFSGAVSASADSLQLNSSTDLTLANLVLAHSGSIDAQGKLTLTGATADTLQLQSSGDLTLAGTITLANGGAMETTAGVLHLTGTLQLNGGTLVLTSDMTPTPGALTDPNLPTGPQFGGATPFEASATIVQDSGTLSSAVGSLLVLRSPKGGSILLDTTDASNLPPVNNLLGSISAVSGVLGENDARLVPSGQPVTLGFIRIASSEIHVAGKPAGDGNQALLQAGIEGDVIKLTADVLTTGTDGLIRARIPYNNLQGSQSSIPGITFGMTDVALTKGGGFGTGTPSDFIQIQVGGPEGGFITALPKGVSGDNAVIFLGGSVVARPFYDGTGKLTEIRIFYNGDAPRTPQEAGALAAVIGLIEEARHERFEEAVRTENVSSRLRSGVIAEVGAGRPATVGRESIRLPDTCEVKPGTLRCE